jgi:hypothetical protein
MSPAAGGNMNQGIVAKVARTLLTNSYTIDACDRPTDGAFLLKIRKRETLGGEAKTVLLFTVQASRALYGRLQNDARAYQGAAVAVSLRGKLTPPAGIRQMSAVTFFALLGGEIRTDRIFREGLTRLLRELGHRRVPKGMSGKAETLLETYCQDGLSYLLNSPVRRFGQERAFEKLPDALVLAPGRLNLCVDAKSYSGGYHPSASDMRAYRDYVVDFNQRYSGFVGPVSAFVVISGHFKQSQTALRNRSDEFLAEASTPLVFMRSTELGEAVALLRPNSHYRSALNWRNVFVPPIFEIARLKKEISRIVRDGII